MLKADSRSWANSLVEPGKHAPKNPKTTAEVTTHALPEVSVKALAAHVRENGPTFVQGFKGVWYAIAYANATIFDLAPAVGSFHSGGQPFVISMHEPPADEKWWQPELKQQKLDRLLIDGGREE